MADAEVSAREWLNRQASGVRGWLMAAAVAGVIAGTLTLIQMGLLAWLISQLIANAAAPASLAGTFLGLVAVIVLRSLVQWGQESVALEAGVRVRSRARKALLDHLAAVGPVRLSDRHSAGLGGQLVDQVEALDGYFVRFLPQLRVTLVLPLILLAVVAWFDWLAALFLLLAAPLIPLFMALVGMGAERLNREQFVAVTRLAGQFLDRVRGLTTLQLFNRAERSVEEVFVAADDYRERSMRTLRLAFLSSAVLEFFASAAIAVVAIYIGFGLLGYLTFGPADDLTLFSGVFILLLAPEFFQPLRTLSQHYHDRAAALGAADGLVALLNEPVPVRHASPCEHDIRPGAVRLRGVCVSHPGRGRVLGPLDFSVVPGECVALVGASGVGKSTLLQLLAGFVESEAGTLDMADSTIAWMDQRPWLIQGSLADNLRLAAPNADAAQLRWAAERAGLGDLLTRLPDGLQASVGERGVGLSGGQAQRVALARVFLSPAPLVLLDEPTASLDADTEALVVASLRALHAEGRTLIVATHHPALMALADRRVTMAQGLISDDARRLDATSS